MTEIATRARFFEQTAAVRPRTDLRLLRVRGADARNWLNGQVTNDVRSTRSGDGVYALVVTPKGKIVADVWVLDRGEAFTLALPGRAWTAVLERLETQIFMEEVELDEERESLVSVQGPRAAEVTRAASIASTNVHRADELGSGGVFVSALPEMLSTVQASLARAAEALGGGVVDEAAFELARLRASRPRFEVDFGDRVFPQEAGLKDLAVSFSKGCYVGQEVVCTLEHRGRLRQALVRLEGPSAPAAGEALTDAEGSPVGEVTSAVTDADAGCALVLGYVKRELARSGGELRVGSVPFTIRGLAGAG